jgi:hypothetical protein
MREQHERSAAKIDKNPTACLVFAFNLWQSVMRAAGALPI